MKAPPSIAVTSTLAMVCAAEARGFETADLLAEVNLTRAFLEDPDARLPGPTVLALWNALRIRTGDPMLQLAAPTSIPFGAYRVIDYLVAASATVGEGVQRFASFFGLIADAIRLDVEEEAGEHRLTLARADGGVVPPVYVDYVFAALVGRVRMRIRPALEVLRLELRQVEPMDAGRHAELFRAPVCFGAAADRLCFSDEEWKAPIDSADAALAQLMEEHARILSHRTPVMPSGFPTELQKAIASTLSHGVSIERVAEVLQVSVRTLQRRLIETGTTFREVSETARRKLAEEYLTDPKVSSAEVAFLLGFSDQSAFNRAFRRWTGESPGRWRRQRT